MRTLLLTLITSTLLLGCSKKKWDLVVKYEIKTTSPITTSAPILTQIGWASPVIYNDFTSGQSWSATGTEDTRRRPIEIKFNAQNIRLSAHGSVTCTIYVNGKSRATGTAQSRDFAGHIEVTTTPLIYTVE